MTDISIPLMAHTYSPSSLWFDNNPVVIVTDSTRSSTTICREIKNDRVCGFLYLGHQHDHQSIEEEASKDNDERAQSFNDSHGDNKS
jgi:hypothetical protein